MTFPNAYNGVKKLFTSQILGLASSVAAVLTVVGIIIAFTGRTSGMVIMAIFAIIMLVLAIIGYIFMLIGLKRGGRDEQRFNQAFIIAIGVLVLSVVSSIFTSAGVGGGIPSAVMDFVRKVGDVVIAVLVINGVQDLAFKLGNEELGKKGNTLLIILIIVNGIAAIVSLISAFTGGFLASLSGGVLSLISGILSIIYYVLYLIFLGKARAMLASK